MHRYRLHSVLAILLASAGLGGCAADAGGEAGFQSGALRSGDGSLSRSRDDSTRSTSVVLDDDAFAVEQIDFVEEGGMSAWGALSVDPIAVARQTGASRGFLSARNELGWVVHNLPIQSQPNNDWPERVRRLRAADPTFVPPVRTYFNLGTESRLRTTDLLVIFTSEPLSSGRDLRTWERARLLPIAVATTQMTQPSGITVPPPDGLPPEPPEAPPVLAPEPIEPELGVQSWYTVSLPAEENVNSAQNQCGPVAYANALAYLEGTFGLDVPHPNIRGLGGGPGLVGILDVLSQRPATDTCNGGSIAYCFDVSNQGGMMNGLYAYLENTDLNQDVVLEHQGVLDDLPDDCADSIVEPDPVSPAMGSAVTVPWIRDHLENGDAVVLAFNRLAQTPNGEVVTSGHMVRIYGYSEVNGQAFLMALDDQQQDRMNNNACQQRDDGLTWETWAVGDSDNDGTLNKGLNNLREITFAMAIRAI